MGELDDDLVGEVARARSAALGAERANEVLQARLAHAVAHTLDLGSSLGAAQTRLTEYREALEDSQREVHRVGEELRRVQGELHQTLKAFALAEQEADRARNLIESLTSSMSWRVTAPLRATRTRLARRGTAALH